MFEAANKGTIFLDEIGEMPLTTQAKLLRVLQNHEVQRVGSPVGKKIDVRVIAATSRSLPAQIEAKQFRQDLFLTGSRWWRVGACPRCANTEKTFRFCNGILSKAFSRPIWQAVAGNHPPRPG